MVRPNVIYVKGVRAMNKALIYSWYEQYKNGVFRYALSILKDPHMAEDVLQETFLKLLMGKGYPDPGREQAWIYKVARNLCLDYLRKMKKEQAEQIASSQESEYAYIELIAPLPQKEQEIVTLKIVGGLTHKEIAAVLNITEKAAQKRYERALAALREMEE